MTISFIRSIILYLFVCVSMRLMGKRQVGELQPFELVIAIMMSDLATIPMQDSATPLLHGIIPILSILLLQTLLSLSSFKSRRLRHFFNGRPRTLIENGVIKIENLRKELFTIADLTSSLRYEGYDDITTVQMAVLETNGNLSIIPKAEPNEHSLALIIDGQVEHTNLKVLGKNIEWLNATLKKHGTTEPESVFYACTIPGGKLFWQTYNEKVFIANGKGASK